MTTRERKTSKLTGSDEHYRAASGIVAVVVLHVQFFTFTTGGQWKLFHYRFVKQPIGSFPLQTLDCPIRSL